MGCCIAKAGMIVNVDAAFSLMRFPALPSPRNGSDTGLYLECRPNCEENNNVSVIRKGQLERRGNAAVLDAGWDGSGGSRRSQDLN